MPVTASHSRQLTDKPQKRTAALVGLAEHRETITVLLSDQGLDVIVVESADELDRAHPDLAVAIAYVEDARASLARALRSLARQLDGTPLVAVCAELEGWKVRAALSAGASGIVPIEALDKVLAPCVYAVEAGMNCVPRAHRRQIAPRALSSREKQILGLVVMGYMNGQIARQLFLAESTVKSHLSSAFGKLGVRSRNEAVKLILDPEAGLGLGILALGGEPLEPVQATAH